MKNVIASISLLVIAVVNSGCPKPCVEANYSFLANSKLSPDLDSIRLGDTLSLTSTFPTSLIDQKSGILIDYSNATDIESTLSIAQLISGDSIPKGSVYDFKYYSQVGMIYNATNIPSPETVQQLKYQQKGNNYQLKVGLIPQHVGIFALGIGNGLSNTRTRSNKCENASFQFTISSTSQHIYYFQNWRPNFILSPLDTLKLYCFKVY